MKMLVKCLFEAYRGKLIWMKIRKKFGVGYTPSRYILFPSSDDEYNAWGIYYMTHYLQEQKFDKVMVIAQDDAVLKACENVMHHNLHLIRVSEKEMKCLVRLFALINLNDEWTIVSVEEPYHTGASNLLGKKGVTKRELIWYDVYRMSKKPASAEILDIAHWQNADRYVKYVSKRIEDEKRHDSV
jgi:hypothetical protein